MYALFRRLFYVKLIYNIIRIKSIYILYMSKIRIINGAGYGERGQSPDDYEIVGLDNVDDVTKSVTIKDRKNKTNNIKRKN